MLKRYIIYGFAGLVMEVIWTGFGSLLTGNLALTGTTFLWMFFIYGSAVLFEPIHNKVRRENFLVRGFIWVFLIYLIEFSTGFILDKLIGFCPWDYSRYTTYTLLGYIRFDYFPAWFLVGMLFEKVHDLLDKRTQNLNI